MALTTGAFAERVAIDVGALAEVPKGLDLAKAVALPVAGVAALRSVRAAGLGPDKRVLVTGASGGVGRFAVQLAARAGAHVIASVGSAARGEGLAEAGADEVLIGLEGLQRPVDAVIDSVGGPQLQSVGWTSGEPAVFPPYATVGPAKSLTSFVIEGDVGADLAVLAELAAEGSLTVEIGWPSSGASPDSSSGAASQCGRTSSPSHTRPHSTLLPSSSGPGAEQGVRRIRQASAWTTSRF